MFEMILGQEPAKRYLQRAVTENRLPNTMLFSGPEGVGKKKMALVLAELLLKGAGKNHPDLHILVPEGASAVHTIESIRRAMEVSHGAPFSAPVKVFIIEAAERMQPAAANALLKTLEEPLLDCYWILIAESAAELLPTIVSRCAKVPFFPLSEGQVAALLEEKDRGVAKYAEGSVAKALELANSPGLEEARKLMVSLLGRTSYVNQFMALERIETLLDNDDPLIAGRHAAHLFASIAHELRSQEGRWVEALDEARMGYERNIKLSTCLESFLLSLSRLQPFV